MTVSTTTFSSTFNGNGTTGPFSFSWPFLDDSHLRVVKTSGGVDTTLTITTDYTVTGAVEDDGGSITLIVALAIGETLAVSRVVPFTQELDLIQGGPFSPEVLETAFDKLTMIAQQIDGDVPEYPFPTPVANKVLGWNSAGTAIENKNLAQADSYTYNPTGGVQRTTAEKFGESVSVKDFGAVGDGVTDDTSAIQDAINWCATNGVKRVYIPSGVYSITTLYFYYDAVNNPGFPTSNFAQGRIALVGDGAIDNAAIANSVYCGTVLVSSSTTAPALNLSLSGAPWKLRGVELKDFTVVQDYAGIIIDCVGSNTKMNFDGLSVYQLNNGGSGIRWKNVWLSTARMVYVWQTNRLGTGIGWEITNIDIAGGMVDFYNCSVDGWKGTGGCGWCIGSDYGTGNIINNINLYSCQAYGCYIGMRVRGSVRAVSFNNCHYESNSYNDLLIAELASTVNVIGGYFSSGNPTNGGIQVGDSTLSGAAREYRSVNIIGNHFISYTTYCVNQGFVGTSTSSLTIYGNTFTGDSGVGVGIQFYSITNKRGVILLSNYYSSFATDVVNGTNLNIRITEDVTYFGRTTSSELVSIASGNDVTFNTFGEVWRITGSTQINTISAPSYGCPKVIIMFTAGPTVKHNTGGAGKSILLAGGADFVATADDTLTLVYDSNALVWREVSRTVI